jgi:hypothetical protein
VAEGPLQALGWSGRHPDNARTGVLVSDKRQSGLPQADNGPQYQPMSGCFIQLAWSAGGFVVALLLWVLILKEPRWTLSIRDVLYWAAVFGMIAARHIDVARYGGRTTLGKPATAQDVRRYATLVLAFAGPAWCVAQSIDA